MGIATLNPPAIFSADIRRERYQCDPADFQNTVKKAVKSLEPRGAFTPRDKEQLPWDLTRKISKQEWSKLTEDQYRKIEAESKKRQMLSQRTGYWDVTNEEYAFIEKHKEVFENELLELCHHFTDEQEGYNGIMANWYRQAKTALRERPGPHATEIDALMKNLQAAEGKAAGTSIPDWEASNRYHEEMERLLALRAKDDKTFYKLTRPHLDYQIAILFKHPEWDGQAYEVLDEGGAPYQIVDRLRSVASGVDAEGLKRVERLEKLRQKKIDKKKVEDAQNPAKDWKKKVEEKGKD